MTLLEKALKASPQTPKIGLQGTEKYALAIAFAKREVTGPQVAAALDTHSNNIYRVMETWLMSGVRQGFIKVELVHK